MLLRRIKPDGKEADKAETVLSCKNDCRDGGTVNTMNGPHEKGAARKPSERFMRKPIKARSRASNSERIRVADLVSQLEEKIKETENGEMKFKGYRPGQEGPTG